MNNIILIFIFILLIFSPIAYGSVLPWQTAVIESIAGLLMLLYLLNILKTQTIPKIKLPGILFFILFMLYGFMQFLGIGVKTIYPYATLTELIKISAYLFLLVLTISLIKTKKQIVLTLFIIISTCFISSIFFLMRTFNQAAPRTLINPDHFSGYLGMVIPIAIGLFLAGKEAYLKKSKIEKQILLLFSIIIMSVTMLFTMSRGGMFSIIFAFLVMIILTFSRKALRNKIWIIAPVITFILLISIWLGVSTIIEKITSVKNEITTMYFSGRMPIWQSTLQIVNNNFLFGTGLGTFSEIFPKYQPPQLIYKFCSHAHCDYFEILSDSGIIGFLLILTGLIILFTNLLKKFFTLTDTFAIGLGIGFIGSISSIGIHSLVDFNLRIPSNAVLLMILIGLFINTMNQSNSQEENKINIRFDKKFIVIPIVPLILLCCFYIITSVKPALADYYFKKSDKQPNNIEKAINFDPLNAKYIYASGKIDYKNGAINDSIKKYKQSIFLNPNEANYNKSLGWLYGQLYILNKNQLYSNNAITYFEKAIQLNPNNPNTHRVYAIWLLETNNTELIQKGVTEYKKAVILDKNLTNEALLKYFEIEKNYAHLKMILPDSDENHYNAMNIILNAGLWDKNVTSFSKDMALAVNKYPYYLMFSNQSLLNGDTTKAISILQDYLKIDPNCAEAYFLIADRSFYDKTIKWDFTNTYYKKAFLNDKENPYYRMWYGIHLSYLKKYNEAQKNLEIALTLDKNGKLKKQIELHLTKCRNELSKIS